MEFKNQDEAWEYWLDTCGDTERIFDDKYDTFKEWLEKEAVGWPDEPRGNQNLQD